MTDKESSEVKIYYMRDNHTFRRLPLDPFAAIEAMREERDEGHTYGMLCSKHPEIDTGNPITRESCIHAKGSDKWDDFELRAWPWLLKAYELSKQAPTDELAALEKQAAVDRIAELEAEVRELRRYTEDEPEDRLEALGHELLEAENTALKAKLEKVRGLCDELREAAKYTGSETTIPAIVDELEAALK